MKTKTYGGQSKSEVAYPFLENISAVSPTFKYIYCIIQEFHPQYLPKRSENICLQKDLSSCFILIEN